MDWPAGKLKSSEKIMHKTSTNPKWDESLKNTSNLAYFCHFLNPYGYFIMNPLDIIQLFKTLIVRNAHETVS